MITPSDTARAAPEQYTSRGLARFVDERAAAMLAVAVLVGLAIGVSIGVDSLAAAGVTLALLGLVLTVTKPQYGIYLLLAFLFAIDRLRLLGYVPYETRYILDVVVVGLTLRLFAETAARHRLGIPAVAWVAFALLAAVAVLSAVVNHEPPSLALVGLRHYLYGPMLILSVIGLTPGLIRLNWTLITVVALTWLQLPVAALEFFRQGAVSDSSSGTLSPSSGPELMMLCIFAITLAIMRASEGRHAWPRLLALALLFLPPLFAGVRAALLLMPIWVALATVTAKRSTGRLVTALLVVVVIAAGSVVVLLNPVWSPVAALQPNTFTLSQAIERETRSGVTGTGRVTAMRQAALANDGDPTAAVVGFGPAVATPSRLGGEARLDLGFVVERTQVSLTLVELGWAGLLAQLLFVVALGWVGRRTPGPLRNPLVSAASMSLFSVWLLYVALFAYLPVWRSTVPALLLGLVVAARLCASSDGAEPRTT